MATRANNDENENNFDQGSLTSINTLSKAGTVSTKRRGAQKPTETSKSGSRYSKEKEKEKDKDNKEENENNH